ncbi:UNVERIFIED_CONTAM: hypothetical protein PYX00_003095 [Menopon gallinae]|uniref:N(6)-L-threonylcarbamoyladenine synthase n=1 Tax=Menopon gallinae TaxID=328185 RepID=A0AAW2HZE8_9NEOP
MLIRFTKLKPFRRLFSDYSKSKYFRVLGIETSCDDTCAAIVDSDRKVLGESKYSQSQVHALHGGIIPEFAESLHKHNLKSAVDEAVEKSQLTVSDVDAIAVTVKPGMPLSLKVGLDYAKDLCTSYGKPLIPIHHMEAHALTVRLLEDVNFPFLVLLISGGHSILALAESISKYTILGETLDISPGVLFDRVSRRLKLRNRKEYAGLQGGVAVEKAAKFGNPLAITVNITNRKRDCNFNLAGLETFLKSYIGEQEELLGISGSALLPNFHDVCASFQYALTKYICQRVETGIWYLNGKGIKIDTVVMSGGVASNEFIKKMLQHVCDHYDYRFVIPPRRLCTDNAVMVAWNGVERLRENMPTVAQDQFSLLKTEPRCPLGESIADEVGTMIWDGKYVSLRKFILKPAELKEKEAHES